MLTTLPGACAGPRWQGVARRGARWWFQRSTVGPATGTRRSCVQGMGPGSSHSDVMHQTTRVCHMSELFLADDPISVAQNWRIITVTYWWSGSVSIG